MVHGDLKGVRFFTARFTYILLNLPAKANILIDETGRALLADFGLLTIISDPTNFLSSSSYAQGGTNRWMSPERIAPQIFGFKDARPTEPSDCYALGMVVYETISGNLPFHKDADITVSFKVVDGKRPPRGAGFTNSLWKMLELCWVPQPDDRPCIKDVLRCLEEASNSPELPPPGEGDGMDQDQDGTDDDDGGMDEDEDDWDSRTSSPGVLNGMSDTMAELSVATSFGPGYLTDRSPSPISTAPVPPAVEAISDSDVDSLAHETIDLDPLITPIDSSTGGTRWSSATPEPTQSRDPPSPKRVKTGWEPLTNEAVLKRREEVESVTTDEEASRLLEEVVGLIAQARTVDGQASMASDISETLDRILKSYTAGSDLPSVGDMSDASHVDHRPNNTTSSNDVLAFPDEFGDFFDFRTP